MSYKLLVGGKSSFVMDFLRHSDPYFQNLSTSDYISDVTNHFDLFKPDGYVRFFDSADEEMIELIKSVRRSTSYNSAPVIIVASSSVCDDIRNMAPKVADLFIKRPVSADNLALRITRFLEEYHSNAAKTTKVDAKKHILVVDDDKSMLKMLKTALGEAYDVTTMMNGILVERFLDSNDVDLIILDYEMPIETGADVYKKLKCNPKGQSIPVCFLTGVTEQSKIDEIIGLKPHAYLFKPVNIDQLITTVSNLTS